VLPAMLPPLVLLPPLPVGCHLLARTVAQG